MIHLALAVACSLAIGAVFKHAGRHGLDALRLLTVNYVVASAFAALLLLAPRPGAPSLSPESLLSPAFLGFSLFAGIFLIAGFFVFARTTAVAGLSVTIAVMRLGVSIPFVVSWLAWDEVPSAAQWAGLALVGGALVLITRPNGTEQKPSPTQAGLFSVAAMLLGVYLTGGVGDLTFKAFDVWFAAGIPQDAFIALAFGVSFLVGVALLAAGPPASRSFSRPEVYWGIFLGLANYGSVLFILGAVARLPGTVVFPINAVSIVVGGAVLGVVLFRERLSPLNLAGVALAAAAVVLLNA